MQTKAINNWTGFLSIIWMLAAFGLIHYIVVPRQIIIGPFWLWVFGLLAVQLVPGLILAVAGLRHGNRSGRISAILAMGLSLWFVWYGLFPALAVLWALYSK